MHIPTADTIRIVRVGSARDIALELLRKSGVQEYAEPEKQAAIAAAALNIASLILYGDETNMALPDVFRRQGRPADSA